MEDELSEEAKIAIEQFLEDQKKDIEKYGDTLGPWPGDPEFEEYSEEYSHKLKNLKRLGVDVSRL